MTTNGLRTKARLLRDKSNDGVIAVKEKKTVEEMERELGLDKVIPASLGTENDVDDSDYFSDWYEEELRNLYEK